MVDKQIIALAEAELERLERFYNRHAVWIALVAFVLWVPTDVLGDRAYLPELLGGRLLVVLGGLLTSWLARRRSDSALITPLLTFLYVTVFTVVEAHLTGIANLESLLLNYGTTYLVYGVVVLWQPVFTLLLLSMTTVGLGATWLGVDELAWADVAANSSTVVMLASLIALTTIIAIGRYKFVRQEVVRRQSLKRRQQALEEQNVLIVQQRNQIARQVRHIRAKNRELEAVNERLNEMNEEKNHLIHVVAHDLRSPVGRMLGLANLIAADKATLTAEQQRYLELLRGAGEDVLSFISHLLDTDRIEQQSLGADTQSVAVLSLLKRVVSQHEDALKRKHLTLRLHPGPEEKYVMANEQLLTQVVTNLVSNAIKYSPTGKEISVGVSHQAGQCLIRVADQGPGISPTDQKKLFGKFQRLSARPTGGESSHGIGLSIVKKFTEAMGGKVWCESQLGEGATFTVSLPESDLVPFLVN